MEYAIPVVLVLLIVAAAVAAFAVNARRKTASDADRSQRDDLVAANAEHGGAPGIGADPTPLADTAEHAGENTADGRTVGGQDADRYGGTGRPLDHYGATVPEERIRDAQNAADRDTGRATGETPRGGTGDRTPTPESERIADRPS